MDSNFTSLLKSLKAYATYYKKDKQYNTLWNKFDNIIETCDDLLKEIKDSDKKEAYTKHSFVHIARRVNNICRIYARDPKFKHIKTTLLNMCDDIAFFIGMPQSKL